MFLIKKASFAKLKMSNNKESEPALMMWMMRLTLAVMCLFVAMDAKAKVIIPSTHSYIVEAITDSGRFYITLYNNSPSVGLNFLKNVENGYYNGLQIHHMAPGYALQFGDRRTVGEDNAEFPLHVGQESYREIQHMDIGMANLENGLPSDKQVIIFLRDAPAQKGMYSILGHVKKGQNIVDRLTKGDRIRQMRIIKYPSIAFK